MTGKEPKSTLALCEFNIDDHTQLIKCCPKGVEPQHTAVKGSQMIAHFATECCETCEFLEQCPAKKQKKSYVVRISNKALTASKQGKQIAENRKTNCSMRAGIEAINSALKRRHGMSRLKVRGLAKSQVVVGLKITAQNFRRFYKNMLDLAKNLQKEALGVSLS